MWRNFLEEIITSYNFYKN